ncbi:MAG: amino acid ABC transporter permease [bacterium]
MEWLGEQADSYGKIFKSLIPAVPATLEITVFSFALALTLGFIIAFCLLSRFRALRWAGAIYVDVIRGIPLVVQILFIYFGLGAVLNMDRFPAGIAAISVCYSAYLGEILRAGIQAIHRGQFEAAYSLGMSPGQTLWHVVLPQAFRIVLPPIANEFIACLKDSSLVSVIGLRELTHAGREYLSATYLNFQTWAMVALMYLVMTFVLSRAAKWLERRLAIPGWSIAAP